MTSLRTSSRAAALVAIGLGAALSVACSDRSADLPTGPAARPVFAAPDSHGIRAAVAAHERHTPALMRIPGVVGTAVGLLPNGKAALKVFLARPDVRGLPLELDGIPVAAQVTGQFIAFSDPTTRQRPAPLGFSVAHPAITAGSIGARVADGSGNVYVLSNNHVMVNRTKCTIGAPYYHQAGYTRDSAHYDKGI